jgi:DNA gyrase subunit A
MAKQGKKLSKKEVEKDNKPKLEIGYIKPVKIEEEMKTSYLDYAMSVIVARALPDVRDGLKPVHRRILYAMHNLGLSHTSKYRKSATVVGEVLGKYHPHGDIAVYDSMVRMAQNFAMRYPLIDGQGNFGSIDGDPAAAMRYTEARMSVLAEELLVDIEKETVDLMDNYDGSQQEPKVLPAKLPNLLINGTLGIAVGMATNIPPHNLSEIIDGITHLIDHPKATIDELLQFIKGPDFPTAGVIYNFDEIKNAYATGRGHILMRGVASIEENKKSFRIIITELPYQVNKASLVEKIADLVKTKKIVGISDLRDESDRDGMRIVIDLKRDAYPQKILNQIYKNTPMQQTFYVNMLSLVNGIEPRVLTLKMMLAEYIKHRQEVICRRTEFELAQAENRAHILKGLKRALDNLDAVIKTIKQSRDRETAHQNLCKKFKFTDIQTKAILEMKLQQLAALERKKILDELKEKLALIKELKSILANPKKILKIIKEELLNLKEKYGDERKTKVHKGQIGEFSEEDLIPNEEMIVTITEGNYIKRIPINTYRTQRRGGKGIIGVKPREEDIVDYLFTSLTHDDVLFFTNFGRVFQLKVYEIPTGSRTSKGQAIVNLLQLGPEEIVTAFITLSESQKVPYLIMGTKQGMIKKTSLSQFSNIRKSGLVAIKIKKGDELKWVEGVNSKDEIIMVSAAGQSIRFAESDVRSMGRGTIGVRGMKLRSADSVISMDIIRKSLLDLVKKNKKLEADLLVVTENGYGKRTNLAHYTRQNRGGVGIKTAQVTNKTGKVVKAIIIDPKMSDVIMISRGGQVIRLPLKGISKLGRVTQGVILMRLTSEDKVTSLTLVEQEKNE